MMKPITVIFLGVIYRQKFFRVQLIDRFSLEVVTWNFFVHIIAYCRLYTFPFPFLALLFSERFSRMQFLVDTFLAPRL